VTPLELVPVADSRTPENPHAAAAWTPTPSSPCCRRVEAGRLLSGEKNERRASSAMLELEVVVDA
jgi:hypothetical protein